MEFSAESLALFLRLESVGVSAAAAIYERLTHLMLGIVVIRGDGVIAIAIIDWRQADRTLWLHRRSLRQYLRNRWCYSGWLLPALSLAGFLILEAILVALAAAVIELVAGIGTVVVVELLHEAAAGTNHLRQRARICNHRQMEIERERERERYAKMKPSVQILHHRFTRILPLRTLNLAATVLALLATIKVVAIALTATVTELLAHAVAAIVEPFDLILGARAVFTGQETKFWEQNSVIGQ